jgi:hypothetical protein
MTYPSAARGLSAGLVGALALVLTLVGCSADRPDRTVVVDEGSSGDEEPKRDAGRPKPKPTNECDADNPFCRDDKEQPPPPPSCGSEQVDLTPGGVNVMVAVSGAASMSTHWSRIQDAIGSLREAHDDVRFGVHVFWGEVIQDPLERFAAVRFCGETRNRVMDVGMHPERELVQFLGSAPPGPTHAGGLLQTSPVIDPLNYYLTNASKLADPDRTNYLLFVTDGNDNCFGSIFTSKAQKLNAYKKLAIELGKKNIRLIPVGFDQPSDAVQTPAFPGATIPGATTGETDLEVLSTLLEYGGSGLAKVPTVDDPTKLAEVITQVGQTVRNCRFTIPATLDPAAGLNPFALDFSVNGLQVERDRKKKSGWDFVDGDTTQVEMFGPACQAIRAGGQVQAHKTCADEVCGTAAIKVETKPRSVLYLLDASASRIECSDGTLMCLMVPDSPNRGMSLSYWEVVGLALGESLIAPINDDISFGLQLFPSKSAAALSCEVAADAEIEPEGSTAISMMREIYQKLPFGLSPVVQVLENVAANPGRLADPAVQGSVVMLTDGGDNCSGASQADIVRRLGEAAGSLHDKGIQTFVVRFGSANASTPAQEQQLRAIVENGGTSLADPADPSQRPYVDASDATALTAALSTISNKLATCSFALGGIDDDADKDAVNLYLNGEVVPYDETGENGWAWTSDERTDIELHGASCEAFKSNRKTSIVVELGCEQIQWL